MKDSSVRPAVLFDTRRQQRLLDGLAHRLQHCADEQGRLSQEHELQRTEDERRFGDRRAAQMADCRDQRRRMLSEWDDAEEQLTGHYERTVVQKRMELNRLAVVFRRKAAEERKAIELKVQQREQQLHEQYENSKNQPGQQKRRDIKRIDDALIPLQESLEQARDLTVSRLDGLPDVPLSEGEETGPIPPSIDEAIASIQTLTQQCAAVIGDMHRGRAAKMVESFRLPLAGVAFAGLWAVIAYFVAPEPPWLWMVVGVIPAGLIVFAAYLVLMMPLKRSTARLYPQVVQIGHAADRCAAEGRKIAAKNAAALAAELIHRRDSQCEAAQAWQTEQLATLTERIKKEQDDLKLKLQQALITSDEEYSRDFLRAGNEMRNKADALAHTITDQLSYVDREIQEQRNARAAIRQAELQHLAQRMKAGVRGGLQRIASSSDEVRERFPDWKTVVSRPHDGRANLDFVPLGWLQVREDMSELLSQIPTASAARSGAQGQGGNGAVSTDPTRELLSEAEVPAGIPVVMHRRLHSGVVIQAAPQYMDRAIDLAHQVLWRVLTGAPPARAKLTLIDPLGRGQHFTGFMALADHDPSLVGHRVWTTDAKIDARLGELAHHVEDVLQASLRDRFARIEDYNGVAGSMAEPYRAVAAVGFPEGLTRDGFRHLRALLESGLRCGIFTVLVCDRSKAWPTDMPAPSGEKVLQLEIDDSGAWHLNCDGLDRLPFQPMTAPNNSLRTQLVDSIGTAAVAAARVEIPLEQILSPGPQARDLQAKGRTDDGIQILIGSQGGNRSLSLRLGEGVKQHVLIAGKTGSGKSTLLHCIITAGARLYTPDQLQFYLLDFKKGVEFKPYADIGLPHARVIGIESEREFGRSVLQRLDEELQQRGEKFRAARAQELADFREATGESMPRIMLVVDEFQELFVRDDRIGSDCTMLLDRLVRQGRSFGIHVVLSSQSLAGAYSLPRATLGQMAVRIAMHCSESDAALILSDDNTAARLISRPGEAIYNDAGGLVEGNQPFQVAWLSSSRHREMLAEITARDESLMRGLPPAVVFEGNRPCRWTPELAAAAATGATRGGLCGLLGESVEIGPPMFLELVRDTGRNVLLMTAPEARSAVLASMITSIVKSDPRTEIVYFDGTRADDGQQLSPWLSDAGINVNAVKLRDCEAEMVRLSELVQQRGDQDPEAPPVLVVVDPLERFRDLRQDDSFNFSLDAAATAIGPSVAFQNVLRDGPPANVFVMVACGSVETLSRWLPRASQHDLELRVLGQMNASDSALLIDSPVASDLSAATMLLYDDSDGRITKFRQCELPDAAAVKDWLA